MNISNIGDRISGPLKYAVKKPAAFSSQPAGWRVPQLLDLQEAIKAADRSEFATDDEVNAFFARHAA